MHINIHGKNNLSITPSLNEHIKKKFERIKRHYINHILHLNITLDKRRVTNIAEVTLTISHHHFHQKYIADDSMYEVIDILFDKLDRQVRRYKEVMKSHQANKQKARIMYEQESAAELKNVNVSTKHDVENITILKKPFSLIDVLLQLETSNKKRCGMGFFLANECTIAEQGNKNHSYRITIHLSKPSFLYTNKQNEFKLFHYAVEKIQNEEEIKMIGLWEEITLAWKKGKDPLVLEVNIIHPPSEFLEDALDYLWHTKEDHRLFNSIRAGCEMLLIEDKKKWQLWHTR